MARRLTDSEYQALKESWLNYSDKTEFSKPSREASFSAGFVAGLSYNESKLARLISFIKGEIPRSEIEEIITPIDEQEEDMREAQKQAIRATYGVTMRGRKWLP